MGWDALSVSPMRLTGSIYLLLLVFRSFVRQRQTDNNRSQTLYSRFRLTGETEQARAAKRRTASWGNRPRISIEKDGTKMAQPLTPEGEPCGARAKEIRLSRRERQVLALVAQGASDNEIAIQLCLSAKTVSWYVKEIRAKIGAHSRAHAVALAMEHGVLSGMSTPEQES
jgi:DNA-binding CsgD family transcriptional regulator